MNNSPRLLRLVLAVVGVVIIVLGLDVAFGGIRTLGWLGPTDFVDVANQADFNVQDNHVRFLGGTWVGIGLVFVIGAVAFQRMRIALIAMCGLILMGGLVRFGGPDLPTLLNMSVLPSLLAELFLFPALALWILRSGGSLSGSGGE